MLKASAAVEFCPARLSDFHTFSAPHDGLTAFEVAAESERAVSANVIVQAESNWYTFQFQNASIVADLAHFESKTVRFDRMLYHTKPMYVQLPPGERIVRWWIYDATSLGDLVFGWDKRGDFQCLPEPDANASIPGSLDASILDEPVRLNPENELTELPKASETVLPVFKIAPPKDITECSNPFVAATTVHVVQPLWPHTDLMPSLSIVTSIDVAVNANGTLAGAWVYTPSGFPDFDKEALRAAELSKYRGGIALCRPAPGNYLFKAEFMPHS